MDEARNEINIDTVKGFVQGDNNIVTNEFFDKARQIDWNARFTLATDLRLESFKLGDTAAAKFPYVVAPVIDIYNDAIQALHTCSTEKDSAKRGILLFGEANAGKTRLAL